jgi:hypothetical protein
LPLPQWASFPIAALTEALTVRLSRPLLSKADWLEIGVTEQV